MDEGDDEGDGAGDDGAEEGDEREEDGKDAEENGIGKTDRHEADGVHDAIAYRHEHLPAEEGDQVAVDGTYDEHEFVLKAGVRDGKIVAPFGFDAPFLQEEVERVNRDEGEAGENAEPRCDAADLSEKPRTNLGQSFGDDTCGAGERLKIE